MNRSDMAFSLPVPSDDNEGHLDYYRIGGDPPAAGTVDTSALPVVLLEQQRKDQHSSHSSCTPVVLNGSSNVVDALTVVLPPAAWSFSSTPTVYQRSTVC